MIPGGPWAIVDVELSERFDRLEAPEAAATVLVIFRFQGAYLGRLVVAAGELPVTRRVLLRMGLSAIAEGVGGYCRAGDSYLVPPKTAYLASMEGESGTEATIASPLFEAFPGSVSRRLSEAIAARRARNADLTASILICTAGRPAMLRECLEHLEEERRRGREIIVVDNAPSADTEAVVRSFDGVRYAPEPRTGLSAARNAAIREASGEIAVFVDDDVRPRSGWIEPLLAGFESDRVAVVCGLVLPFELRADPQIVFELALGFGGMSAAPLRFDETFRRKRRWSMPVWDIGAGANMAVRRDAVIRLGGFDERLGPGAAGGCGDEFEFWHRALCAGYEARYEPLSEVLHKHRDDWVSLRRQAHGYAKGHAVSLMAQFSRVRELRDLRRVFVALPLFLARRALARLALGWTPPGAHNDNVLIWKSIRGHLAALRHAGLIFARPDSGLRVFAQVAENDADGAPRSGAPPGEAQAAVAPAMSGS